jgi:hypothetical protein
MKISPNIVMIILGGICFAIWMGSFTAGLFAGCALALIDPQQPRW